MTSETINGLEYTARAHEIFLTLDEFENTADSVPGKEYHIARKRELASYLALHDPTTKLEEMMNAGASITVSRRAGGDYSAFWHTSEGARLVVSSTYNGAVEAMYTLWKARAG